MKAFSRFFASHFGIFIDSRKRRRGCVARFGEFLFASRFARFESLSPPNRRPRRPAGAYPLGTDANIFIDSREKRRAGSWYLASDLSFRTSRCPASAGSADACGWVRLARGGVIDAQRQRRQEQVPSRVRCAVRENMLRRSGSRYQPRFQRTKCRSLRELDNDST